MVAETAADQGQHLSLAIGEDVERRARAQGRIRPGDELEIPALIGLGVALAALIIVLGFFVAPLRRDVQHRPPRPRSETIAYRWSRVVQRRPWTAALGAGVALLVLALPVLHMRLGYSDESNFADDTTTKRAYDLTVEGFGKGSTGPLYLVAPVRGNDDVGPANNASPTIATPTPRTGHDHARVRTDHDTDSGHLLRSASPLTRVPTRPSGPSGRLCCRSSDGGREQTNRGGHRWAACDGLSRR